ncbi:hypothetical protein MTO96_037483 [Rhipicephalus appendiculatus]
MNFSIPFLLALFLIANATLSWGRHSGDFDMQHLRRSTDSTHPEGFTVRRCPFASKLATGFVGGFGVQDLLDNSDARQDQFTLTSGADSSCSCATNVECDPEKPFRELGGTCNNLEHPLWGSAGSCMRRELPPAYNDCVSAVRLSVSGRPLPSARLVSMTIHPQRRSDDRNLTNIGVMFGQLLTHDISLAAPGPPVRTGDRTW